MKKQYAAYGLWQVTTEGDCEGKTTTNLGVHEGYLDDIAFSLGSRAYYSLQFQKMDKSKKPAAEPPKPVESV